MADNVAGNIDIPNEPSFVNYFRSMPACTSEVVRMFDRGGFYTIHGEAAVMVATQFLNTTQAIRSIGPENNRLESVSISQARYETFLRFLLVENNYRVEIYGKLSNKSKLENDWSLKIKASPGCLGELEEILYAINVNNVLNQNAAALYLDSAGDVHFASINIIDCTIYLGSFKDDSSYTLLESLLVRLNPKECLLPDNLSKDRIKMMLRKNDILFSEYAPSKKALGNAESVLGKLVKEQYKSTTLPAILGGSRPSLVAFNALLDYLNILSDPYCYANYHLRAIEPETFVRLDLSSISNLHLFPTKKDNKNVHSLFQVLNHCKSASGRKLLDAFIRQPLTNLEQIEQRLDIVEFFRENTVVSSAFHNHFLAKIPDITKVYKKFTNGRCKLQDIYQVYQVAENLPLMLNTFDPADLPASVKLMVYDKLKELHKELEPFRQLVEKSIDFEYFNETRQLRIDASINEELAEIKDELDRLHQEANKELESVRRDLHRNFSLDKAVVTMQMDKFGFYFRVTKQYASCIFRSKHYEELTTGGTFKDCRFLSAAIKKVSHEFLDYTAQYDVLQQNYIAEFIDQTRAYMESILKLESTLAFTDVMVALCQASQQGIQQYRRPKMLPKGSGRLVLRQFRHPIIEILKEMNFVANDVHFDRSQYKCFVITGPNMGGKSTFIRSVALCVLMAQIGSFVPCDEAEISIVDAIYTRISASDNPTLGLSTFMSECSEAAAILRSSTSDSLIVIDELGRSTGTFDGFGIAQGITDFLANQTKAFTLFATHFHSLAMDIPTVGRLAMKSSMENGVFVNHYQAETGTSENSFGVELAKSAGMPERIVERAADKLARMQKSLGDNAEYERLIAMLEGELMVGKNKLVMENNDDQTKRQQYLKAQIKQKLRDLDWSQFGD